MGKEIRKVVVDLTGCKYYVELHQRLKESLDFPEGYGMNWSAFWDMIHRDLEYDFITVIGANTVHESLKPSIEKMKEIMERNKKSWAHVEKCFDYEFIDK